LGTFIAIISSAAGKTGLIIAAMLCLFFVGCTDESPDTSAPERIEIDRFDDWQGALLYIADGSGPVEGWGSIRIYDNVSGFVEMSVEQTYATVPSDLHVTGEGSTMYVSGMATGVVDLFFWDGNGWRRGTNRIVTPSPTLFAIEAGPDGILYLGGTSADGATGTLYRLDPANNMLLDTTVAFTEVSSIKGITWSDDETIAYLTGPGPDGPMLLTAAWPSLAVTGSMKLPVADVNQPVMAPDGKTLIVASRGELVLIDPGTGDISGSLKPAPEAGTEYFDVAFSADGRYLFSPGTPPGSDSTLYIIDLDNGAVVHSVAHVSKQAIGVERVE
jgi:WD40 repeat protein